MTGLLKKSELEHPLKGPRMVRPQKGVPVAKDNPKARPFRELLEEFPKFVQQPCERYRVKDGNKGLMVWEAA